MQASYMAKLPWQLPYPAIWLGVLTFFFVTFCLKGGDYMLSEINTFCRNASTTNSEWGHNALLVWVMANWVNVKPHCFLPCCILTKFVCTFTCYFLKEWYEISIFIATSLPYYATLWTRVTRSMRRCCVKLAATTLPCVSQPFRRFKQKL